MRNSSVFERSNEQELDSTRFFTIASYMKKMIRATNRLPVPEKLEGFFLFLLNGISALTQISAPMSSGQVKGAWYNILQNEKFQLDVPVRLI